jgi:hypothetical protein
MFCLSLQLLGKHEYELGTTNQVKDLAVPWLIAPPVLSLPSSTRDLFLSKCNLDNVRKR